MLTRVISRFELRLERPEQSADLLLIDPTQGLLEQLASFQNSPASHLHQQISHYLLGHKLCHSLHLHQQGVAEAVKSLCTLLLRLPHPCPPHRHLFQLLPQVHQTYQTLPSVCVQQMVICLILILNLMIWVLSYIFEHQSVNA